MATATSVIEDDPIEMLYERGVTDGLPVVPPTRTRVERMLAGAPWRRPDELIGILGPCNGNATVEKAAINAVMAGCKPEYFPVVLAGVEGLCDVRLCAHGLSIIADVGRPAGDHQRSGAPEDWAQLRPQRSWPWVSRQRHHRDAPCAW